MKKSIGMKHKCWSCGAKQDCVTGINHENAPDVGDIAMCFMCGEWGIFDDEPTDSSNTYLSLRKPTDEEFEFIAKNTTCHMARLAWLQLIASRKDVKH